MDKLVATPCRIRCIALSYKCGFTSGSCRIFFPYWPQILRPVYTDTKQNGPYIRVVCTELQNVAVYVYTVFLKTHPHWFMVITSVDIDQFSKFFHRRFPRKLPEQLRQRFFYLTLIMLLHYFLKSESSKQLCLRNNSFVFLSFFQC